MKRVMYETTPVYFLKLVDMLVEVSKIKLWQGTLYDTYIYTLPDGSKAKYIYNNKRVLPYMLEIDNLASLKKAYKAKYVK